MVKRTVCGKHNNNLVVILLAVIAGMLYYNYRETRKEDARERERIVESQRVAAAQQEAQRMQEQAQMMHNARIARAEMVRRRNIDRLVNPLVPPLRDDTRLPPGPWTVPVSVPTRGEYGPFQTLGFLTMDVPDADDKIVPLMGRRIHSNQFEYFTFHPDNEKIKVPIDNSKELFNGDTVTMKDVTGDFKVTMYDMNAPRYIPY